MRAALRDVVPEVLLQKEVAGESHPAHIGTFFCCNESQHLTAINAFAFKACGLATGAAEAMLGGSGPFGTHGSLALSYGFANGELSAKLRRL